MVAILDARAEHLRRSDRELHFDLAAGQGTRHFEAGVAEDGKHGAVIREHLGDEPLDTGFCCALGQPLQQPRPHPTPLQLVGDREGDLRGGRIAQPRVAR